MKNPPHSSSSAKSFNLKHLDVGLFAAESATLEGELTLDHFPRLMASVFPATESATSANAPAPVVVWRFQGETRPVRVGLPEIWLHLTAQVTVDLECQRCLGPVSQVVNVDQSFRFVKSEEEAAALDLDTDEDLLVLSRLFNAEELLEDELLLALPIVPYHTVCPVPLTIKNGDQVSESASQERENPFAVLAQLKKAPPSPGNRED